MGVSVSSPQVLSHNKEVLWASVVIFISSILLAGYARQAHSLGRAGLQCWAAWLVLSWLLVFQKAQFYLWLLCALWVSLGACGLDLAFSRGCSVSNECTGPGLLQ